MAGEIFISYRHADEGWAKLLHAELKQRGVDAWYDAQVGAGQDWRSAIAAALQNARIFVLLYSKAAASSDDIAKELAAATYSKKLIVPVRLEDIPPQGAFLYELASRNWINAFDNTAAQLTELAASLAALVETGNLDPAALPFQRASGAIGPAPAWRKRAPALAAALLAVIVAGGIAFALSLYGGGRQSAPGSTPGRVAFFGVTAPSGDAKATAIAEQTAASIVATFNAQQQEMASSAETIGTPPDQRLDRTRRLGATYAVSGEVTRNAEDVAVTLQLEDAPSRTLLWSETVHGQASAEVGLATQAAALVSDRFRCISKIRASLGRSDIAAIARLPQACANMRQDGPRDTQGIMEISKLAPHSAYLQSFVAIGLARAFRTSPQGPAADQIKADAIAAVDRANRLDPSEPELQIARVAVAQIKGAGLMELESLYLQGLQRAPQGVNINAWYGGFLVKVGRVKDAIPYHRLGFGGDPLSAPKQLSLAQDAALTGQTADSADLLSQVHERVPSPKEWSNHIAWAVFNKVADPAPVLAAPPAGISAPVVACWAAITLAAASKDQTVRRHGAARAEACSNQSEIDPGFATLAAAALGDLDAAFQIAEQADSETLPYAIFNPQTTTMRADSRFLALMERRKYLAYWKASGHAPDFCATEKIPVCAALGR